MLDELVKAVEDPEATDVRAGDVARILLNAGYMMKIARL